MRNRRAPLRGRVQKNPRGFAFILSGTKGGQDVFVANEEAAPLMSGDLVEYIVERKGRRPSARILKIIERRQKELFGYLEKSGKDLYLVTLEGEGHLVPHPNGVREGRWALAQIDRYPTHNRPSAVTIIEEYGPELEPKHDLLLATSRYGLDTQFSDGAIADAERGREIAATPPDKRRKDLRNHTFVTIDGEDAKDFDDAICVERPKTGPAFILYVAIADVSHFVRPGSHLDKAALKRGTSVYFPGVCIPMLPETLSNDLCSLRPRENRFTLTAEIHLDREGAVIESFFYEGLICTVNRLTYTQVHQYFEKDSATREELKHLDEMLGSAQALHRKLEKQRAARGVLDFELPESKILVDKEGWPTSVYRAERWESHRLIEEFMILANREVARALRESGTGTLYRVHEAPEPGTLDDLKLLLRTFGVSVPLNEISPRLFARLLAATAEKKGAKTIHKAILRLQKQARYEPEPKGHFGLALNDYTHFTSPIRRYPDLVVHRSLKRLIYRERGSDTKEEGISFDDLGRETSEAERRAMEAERYVVKRKQAWFLSEHVGEEFQGNITGVESHGLFVEIPQYSIEGFLPVESLLDRYRYDEKHQCLRRQKGHTTLSLGDTIYIRIEKVSVVEGQITLMEATP